MSARDGFERYYEEKLWALLPEVHRVPDADGTPPDAMRAVVRLVARSAARMRREIDRTWEDQSIEACDADVIERFAELLGTRPVAALDARARRVDVATTIHARRRRGTPYVLEATARSLAGWDIALVEAYRTLARSFHGLDDPPSRTRGRWSGTPRGGTADLRSALGAELGGGAFSDFAHTADLRLPRGRDGWHAIRTLRFHVFPWRAFEIEGSDPEPLGDPGEATWTFDPSGRDVPLFARGETLTRPARQVRRRGDPPEAIDGWDPVAPWEVRAPISCRLLGSIDAGGKAALIPDSLEVGRVDASGVVAVTPERTSSGDLSQRARHPVPRDTGVELLVDPERGRLAWTPASASPLPRIVRYHVGLAMEIGALPIDRRALASDPAPRSGGGAVSAPAAGVLTLEDSRTYALRIDATPRADLTLQAGDRARPYARVSIDDATPGARVVAAPGDARTLVIEGLWLGSPDERDAPLSIEGTWAEVVVRDATLDPSGARADGRGIGVVPIVVRGRVDVLRIERSILASIRVDVAAGASIGRAWIRDSIVDGRADAIEPALALGDADADLARTTVLGDLTALALEASDCVVLGEARIADTTRGCFRFSAAHGSSRLPRRFEPWPEVGSSERVEVGFFRSLRFGDPDYARVAAVAPEAIRSGAETGGERGAYARLGEARLARGVAAKVDELAPVGVRSALFRAELDD